MHFYIGYATYVKFIFCVEGINILIICHFLSLWPLNFNIVAVTLIGMGILYHNHKINLQLVQTFHWFTLQLYD